MAEPVEAPAAEPVEAPAAEPVEAPAAEPVEAQMFSVSKNRRRAEEVVMKLSDRISTFPLSI